MKHGESSSPLALIGYGRIGAVLAMHFASCGHDVFVFDAQHPEPAHPRIHAVSSSTWDRREIKLAFLAVAGENLGRYPSEAVFRQELRWIADVLAGVPLVSLVGGITPLIQEQTFGSPVTRFACSCGISQPGALALVEAGSPGETMRRLRALFPNARWIELSSERFAVGVNCLVLAAIQNAIGAAFLSRLPVALEPEEFGILRLAGEEAARMAVAAGSAQAAFDLSATPSGSTRRMAEALLKTNI